MTRTRLLLLAAIVAAIVGAVAALPEGGLTLELLKRSHAGLIEIYRERPALSLAGFGLIYVLVAALGIPGAAVMTLAAGAVFGFWTGLAVASLAATIGALLAFLLARYLLHDWVQQRFEQRLRRISHGVRKEGAFYLFGLRLVPLFPYFLINLVMALTPIRVWTYTWISWIGMLPGTAAYVNAGTQLAQIESTGDIISAPVLGAFVILALLPPAGRLLLRRLRRWRHYRSWPRPRRFDANLVVIGGGAAGLVAAYVGATLKAKVVLIERDRMGGDCLNTGCVPSKALLRSARTGAELAHAADRGWASGSAPSPDFARIMARIRRVIQTVEPHDSEERYRGLGVEVVRGEARLISPWTVEVGDRRISARNIILATGAEPLVPPLPGLDDIDYLTSETLWRLEALPERLAIVGGGAVGCEMAQAFARLGSRVTVLELARQLLPQEDPEVAAEMAEVLRQCGVELRLGTGLEAIAPGSEGSLRLTLSGGASLAADRLLLAVGRRPVTAGLGLEGLGLEAGERGELPVDDQLRTELPNILACGDVLGHHQLTHAGAHEGWHAAVNALVGPTLGRSISYAVMPQVVYTEPEFARVGLNEREAVQQGVAYEVTHYQLDELDRAIADDARRGFIKVLTRKGTDRILGVAIVADRAAEMLTEFQLALRHKIGLGKLMTVVRPYPSYAEGARFAAGQWRQAHAPERLLSWLARFHRWRRG